jgi:hypothetical protein
MMAQLLASAALVLALVMLGFVFYFRRRGAAGAGANGLRTALGFVLIATVVNTLPMALGFQSIPALSILSIGLSGAGAFALLQGRFSRRSSLN